MFHPLRLVRLDSRRVGRSVALAAWEEMSSTTCKSGVGNQSSAVPPSPPPATPACSAATSSRSAAATASAGRSTSTPSGYSLWHCMAAFATGCSRRRPWRRRSRGCSRSSPGAAGGGPPLARVRTNPAFAKFVAVNVDVWVLGLCVPWNMLVSRLGRRDAALRPRPVHWLPARPKVALVGVVLASYHLLPVDEGDGDSAMDIVLDFLFRCLVSWFAYPN
jgi:hypothetical protein